MLLGQDAMLRFKSILGERIGGEFFALWLEYERGLTAESRLVKQLDKFEMKFQALEYEKEQPSLDLEDFFASTRDVFSNTTLRQWDRTLLKEREMLRRSRRKLEKEESKEKKSEKVKVVVQKKCS